MFFPHTSRPLLCACMRFINTSKVSIADSFHRVNTHSDAHVSGLLVGFNESETPHHFSQDHKGMSDISVKLSNMLNDIQLKHLHYRHKKIPFVRPNLQMASKYIKLKSSFLFLRRIINEVLCSRRIVKIKAIGSI